VNKALISGATGFVGGSVYHYLQSKGVDVLAVIHSDSASLQNPESLAAKNIKYVVFDLEKKGDLKAKLNELGWDTMPECVFYHFAWHGAKNLTDGDLLQQMNNVQLATESIRHAKKVGCSRFINAGTFEETLLEEGLMSQLSEPPIDISSIPENYTIAKIASRNMCYLIAYIEKIDYIHTRFSVPLSESLSTGKYIEKQLQQIRENQEISTPHNKNPLNFIHIDDLARAYYEIGVSGANKADYLIRTNLTTELEAFFTFLQNYKKDKSIVLKTVSCDGYTSMDAAKRFEDWFIDHQTVLSHVQKFVLN
jgi:nucleoside-diphosphate-sugar epimerase